MEDEKIELQDTDNSESNSPSNTQDYKKKTNLFPALILAVLITVGAWMYSKSPKPNESVNTQTNIPQVESTDSSTISNSITLDEISKHSTREDCWIVIEEKVYDVTSFVPNHPGKDAILFGCGKDATAMFNKRPKDGTSHSDRARVQLTKLQIGVLGK